MLEPLKQALPGSLLIATTVPATSNSLPPADLSAAWGKNSTAIADTDAAFEVALTGARGTLIVCGSLYLVGYVRNKVT
jgi:folylpolyglutamate synthase/dihydropteroate synthase